jgi:hypothetical protein
MEKEFSISLKAKNICDKYYNTKNKEIKMYLKSIVNLLGAKDILDAMDKVSVMLISGTYFMLDKKLKEIGED